MSDDLKKAFFWAIGATVGLTVATLLLRMIGAQSPSVEAGG